MRSERGCLYRIPQAIADRRDTNNLPDCYRGPAHRAKKTKAFVETLAGRLKLFFLPPYSPDRNPDEPVWKHLKADTVGRMVVTDKADFKGKVVSSMRSLQRNPDKICSFFQKPSLQYAA